MKKVCLIIGIAGLAAVTSLCVPKGGKAETVEASALKAAETSASSTDSKVIVAYFTWPETDGVDASSGASRVVAHGKVYGNTEYIAGMIAEATGGDLFAIKTERNYPGSHKELIDEAKREAEAGEHPRLVTHIENLKDYDVIFVGYPNWWYDMPMAIYTFFEEYDFSGKTVIPFCTHGGSRFSRSVETITGMEKNARVVRGLSVAGRDVPEARQTVRNWLEKQNLLKH